MKAITKPLMLAGALCTIVGAVAFGTSAAASATAAPTCVDGSQAHNLSVTWNSLGNVTVHTVNNAPLCADTTLYFSSYTMPDNYDGGPFDNNATATPQTVFDSTSAVLKKDTDGTTTMTIKLPEACKNMQIDLYYPPEITTVTPAGHGAQYITGKMVKSDTMCTPDTPPEQPPVVPPTEAQTPPEQPAQVTVAPQAPAELPSTGTNIVTPLVVSGVIAAGAYGVSLFVQKRRG
ncbi:MAG TPA: hypothetical protein VHT70_03865 [Candidatus Saccharimonadales bacterium]|jgi:hypothetical protein|nr:hypothetical protein [Candidatus Saccharimonadales bacterium]